MYGFDFRSSGDYKADCCTGRDLAEAFLQHKSAPIRLPHLVEAMERPLSGVAIGFLTAIAERAK